MNTSFKHSWLSPRGLVASVFAAALALSAGRAAAQNYVTYGTTFDNFTSETLSGQDSWNTTDTNQSDYVGIIPNYSAPGGTDKWGAVGGLYAGEGFSYSTPSSSPVYIYRPFSLGTATSYAFNVDFGVSSSSSTNPNQDTFGWTFQNALSQNVFSINFDPSSTAGVDAVRYQIGLATEVSTGNGIVLNSKYHLTVSVNLAALPTATFSASLVPLAGGSTVTLASNVPLTGVLPGTVDQIAGTWKLLNSAAPGDNALFFNNYVVTIPEPSTWAMLFVGAGLLAVAVRRRAKA